jgi:quercetin dioxygenase-like cupin family protein
MIDPAGLARLRGKGPSLAILGGVYTTLLDGEDTGGAFALFDSIAYPGTGPGPHRHEREQETFYILEGEVTFRTDGQTVVATPGAVIHMPRRSPHAFHNAGPRVARKLVLVAPAGMEHFFAAVGTPVSDPTVPPGEPTAEEIERVIRMAPQYGIEMLSPTYFDAKSVT